MAASNPIIESTSKSRVTQIFQFLRAFYSLRTKTILQIADQPWIQWLRDLPDHECIWVANESDLQQSPTSLLGGMDEGVSDTEEDSSIP